jgi:hypothetical protein
VTWLPHKEKFVGCYINQFPHFGSSSTSRVEGNHHVIKSYVRLGKLDLFVVFKRLSLMLANQKVELSVELERQKLLRAHHLTHDVFKNLHYRVSLFALDKIYDQWKIMEDNTLEKPCSHQFTRTWGLPCQHALKNLVERNGMLELEDIHLQWHLEKQNYISSNESLPNTPRKKLLAEIQRELYSQGAMTGSLLNRFKDVINTSRVPIQEPSIVLKRRGRPAGSRNKNSLTRDKSLFEYTTGRKCSICGSSGHNSRSCKSNKK